jgi:hypothetical protein
VGIVVEVIVEGIGIAQPVKIKAKNGITKPIHLKVTLIFIMKVYLFKFKKKEFFESFAK